MTPNLIVGLIIIAIWVIGIPISYKKFFSNYESNKKWEQVWFACAWPAVLPVRLAVYIVQKK